MRRSHLRSYLLLLALILVVIGCIAQRGAATPSIEGSTPPIQGSPLLSEWKVSDYITFVSSRQRRPYDLQRRHVQKLCLSGVADCNPDTPTEVQLALATDTQYAQADSNGNLTLLVHNTLVWAISWLGIPCPRGNGGPVVTPSTAGADATMAPTQTLCDKVAFVDARSGKFIYTYLLPHQWGSRGSDNGCVPYYYCADIRASGACVSDFTTIASVSPCRLRHGTDPARAGEEFRFRAVIWCTRLRAVRLSKFSSCRLPGPNAILGQPVQGAFVGPPIKLGLPGSDQLPAGRSTERRAAGWWIDHPSTNRTANIAKGNLNRHEVYAFHARGMTTRCNEAVQNHCLRWRSWARLLVRPIRPADGLSD
jgi:hypothetical protein